MQVDTLILGAGAAGMMAAAHCGGRVLIVDHAKAAGEKIRISGGGRCNFTNTRTGPENFLSENPHFAKSALSRYSPWDFIDLVDAHGIAWHEKTLGQLFCDGSAKEIIAMLRGLMTGAGAEVWLETSVSGVEAVAGGFKAGLTRKGRQVDVTASRVVVATGGKSIPKMGASGLAYDIARQFGLAVTQTRPALVPLTFSTPPFGALSGVAVPVEARAGGVGFEEAMLITHRGLSGPAILQASSYWQEGDEVALRLAPATLFEDLRTARQHSGRKALTTALGHHLPGRLVEFLAGELDLKGNLADQSDARLAALCDRLADWRLRPGGTEGYRTAEVTVGGVATTGLSSRTMEAVATPGLYFIGEAVDVTGWLGGYNFQWAWASAMACALAIAAA